MKNFAIWKYDIRSSLVVFLVALPLCLGIALASNAPLSSGLIAGMIGGIVVGFISNSHVSVSGPAAGLTVIVAAGIVDLGSFPIFSLSLVFAGLVQLIFSFVNGGSIGNYFPTSVIKGMLAAIGLILILKQFPHALGIDSDFMGDESFFQADGRNTFTEILYAIKSIHQGASLIALISMFIIIGWEKGATLKRGKAIFQLIPGALVAVLFSVIINEIFKQAFPHLVLDGVHLVILPDFISGFAMPDWSAWNNPKVYTVAMVLAIVGSIETLLSVEAGDKIDPHARFTNKNRELFAQGIGNSLSGLIGGLPVTAVIVRTSANVVGGAKTKLSAILHGFWLLICVVSIPHILNLIPLSCLAAVLILVGFKLTKPSLIHGMYKRGSNQFVPFAATIIAILFTDLLLGIMIGMGVGFIFVIRSSVHESIVMVNDNNHYLIRFYKDVNFLQKGKLLKLFDQIPSLSNVVIDGSNNVYVDDDISELIGDYLKRAKIKGITVELKKSTTALSPLFRENHDG
jgi:MFS superfamily sulfate permease-like transporter